MARAARGVQALTQMATWMSRSWAVCLVGLCPCLHPAGSFLWTQLEMGEL